MCRKIGLLIGLMVGLAASAETVNLSGVVSNQNGKPIKGAVVRLVKSNLADTTNEKGEYSFGVGTAVNHQMPTPNIEKISINKGSIRFNLSKASRVKIEMFDVSGSLLKRELNHYTSAGEYCFDLSSSPFAARMTAVRVSIGGYSATFRYLLSSGRITMTSSSNALAVPAGVPRLAKIQAAVDTLNVSAKSFIRKFVPVPSFDDNKFNVKLDTINLPKFSFFITSLKGLQELSKSEKGFGGDLRFGKTGQGAGILGADSICKCLAEKSMTGSGVKEWRAFLSAKVGPDGKQVNAIERIGEGPWYDRIERLFANKLSELINSSGRPSNAHSSIKNDFPNEEGVLNSKPNGGTSSSDMVDNHLTITGSGTDGKLFTGVSSGGGMDMGAQSCQAGGVGGFPGFPGGGGGGGTITDFTCNDWTSTTATSKPRAGFSWPQSMSPGMGGGFGNMKNWISEWCMNGCEAGIDLSFESMAGDPNSKTIGSGGGYGGFYCFALNP